MVSDFYNMKISFATHVLIFFIVNNVSLGYQSRSRIIDQRYALLKVLIETDEVISKTDCHNTGSMVTRSCFTPIPDAGEQTIKVLSAYFIK